MTRYRGLQILFSLIFMGCMLFGLSSADKERGFMVVLVSAIVLPLQQF
ncbi:hypothetical protein [Melghirimyces algeriensis]|uniref:Uncharacterized protein n=1 Tax=Melghirimyces algeriensis TaxID=910412 RepID=A0A521CWJ8_9BACL|nr:hypothetical protein [Melghirimyces algeriensis]SMO63829.1 hypothetical protein SAMN06264849_104266 [Melghirimyces algeriensis]